MVTYDPKIIRAFANDLYRIADRVVLMTTLKYGLIGAVIGASAGAGIGGVQSSPITIGAVILGAIAGFIGRGAGEEKAFAYKLQAQTALCQVQIESNTALISQPK